MLNSIVFADLTHSGTIKNADTFPLGIGCIAANVVKEFGGELHVEIFKFVDEFNSYLLQNVPRVVCLSNYCWNANLSMHFAKYLHEAFPDTVVIMGEPNISLSQEEREVFLKNHPCIDYYCKFEGEQAIVDLYRALKKHDFNVALCNSEEPLFNNMIYLSEGKYREGAEIRIRNYAFLPSPYLMGLMDKFFDQSLRPLVEYTRGCPFSCTFCTDSHTHRNKVFCKDQMFVKAELEYIASRVKTSTDLVLADLNFGMYRHDVDTALHIRSIIDKYGWPKSISGSPGKMHPDRIMKCIKIINGENDGIMKFASSVQSTNDNVITQIRRKNLPVSKLREIMESSNKAKDGTEYFTEIILALPGDSVDTHYQSLRDAIDNLGMNIVNVHQLTLLPGSPMALDDQRAKYEMDVRYRVFVGCIGEYLIGTQCVPVAEIEAVVVASNTMSYEDWINCRVMSLLVKIYIDRDCFVEIFGLIRHLGLSSVDLLVVLKDEILKKYPRLKALFALFIFKTKEPLHRSLQSALMFATQPENIRKYATGELGGNELLVHRAKAYLDYGDDLHAALRDAALLYLKRMGRMNKTMQRYVKEAVIFSQARKFNPCNFTCNLRKTFTFDFIKAKNYGFQVLPDEVMMAPRDVRFYFSDRTLAEIRYAIKTWVRVPHFIEALESNTLAEFDLNVDAQTRFDFGKLFHNINLKTLNRTAEYLPSEV